MTSIASNRLRLVLALAGVNVLLAAGGWLLLVAPQRHDGQSASQQLQQVQQQLTQFSASGVGQTHAKQPLIRTAGLYRLAQAMPVTADEPDLLLALDQLARASGVKVLQISPGAPTPAVGYVVLPISLSLSGSYGSLTGYLHRLRMLVAVRHGRLFASGRLVSVSSVTLAPATQGKDETATVAANAYVYGPVGGVAPASTSTTSTSTSATSTTSTTTTTGG
ncbi:MAG TPA: type 4a pilus biogenesis protein PilO [Gaiellaceae bacterium]|nr:type 4a pilus biogenesis protein PilO [Gaiellaceae bacterium]